MPAQQMRGCSCPFVNCVLITTSKFWYVKQAYKGQINTVRRSRRKNYEHQPFVRANT